MNPTPSGRSFADVALRVAADAIMLAASFFAALTLRYLGVYLFEPEALTRGLNYPDYLTQHLDLFPVLVLTALLIFHFNGFYTFGRAYRGRYKLLVVFQAVTLAYVVFGFLAFLFREMKWFPRSALLLSWAFSVPLLVGSRIWSTVWKRIGAREHGTLPTAPAGDPRAVLVVGGAGYIGSALVGKLLERGYRVRVLDVCLFGDEPIRAHLGNPRLEVLRGDFRHLEKVAEACRGMGAVVHLGGIVGDPACAVDEDLTIDVNVVATKMLAEVSKGSGIRRFVFASSCSVYGASNEVLDELSALKPLSLYAKSKIASEKVLREMSGPAFAPAILRFATIYGFSGRTRFDLVVNLLTARALTEGKITVFGGDQWRPFVHVEDAALGALRALEAPEDAVRGEIFNIGSEGQNQTIKQVAERIRAAVAGSEIVTAGGDTDARNYKVGFAKARRLLGFAPEWTLDRGIEQVVKAFRDGIIPDYRAAKHHNVTLLTEDAGSKLIRPAGDWAREAVRAVGEPGPTPAP